MAGRIPDWWSAAHAYLLEDEILGQTVKTFGPDGITSRDDLFQTLVRSIVGQQISVLAADAIWKRLVEHLGSVTPEAVLATDQTSIAACGLTRPKASYIYGLAEQKTDLLRVVGLEQVVFAMSGVVMAREFEHGPVSNEV